MGHLRTNGLERLRHVGFSDKVDHGDISGRHIALTAGAYNHIADGVALTLNRLVRYLEGRGAKVLVFAPTSKAPPPFEHAGTLVPVPSVPWPGRSDYRLSLGLSRKGRARLEAFRPDLVHIASPDLCGMQALLWANMHNVPVVSSFHTHFSAYFQYFTSYNRFYRMDLLETTAWRYGRWFYPQCQHIYVPSPSIADELRSRGISNGIRLWPRGVDPDTFHPRWRSASWRQKLGLRPEDVVVTFVGRLVWEKGLDVFAQVISNLEARGVPHRSVMVGDGPAYKKLSERLPNTVFTGPLSNGSLGSAYASSDVFLFPSDTETFGNVTLEAMASGLPTVCADATGSDALVIPEVTGFLARPKDADDFTDKVERLLVDASLRETMGTRARSRALLYSWDHAMARMSRFYDDLLNRQHSQNGLNGHDAAPVLAHQAA